MIAFLNFVVNCVLFSSSLYSMSATKSKEEIAPILSRPRHFVLVLPRPFISQGLVWKELFMAQCLLVFIQNLLVENGATK